MDETYKIIKDYGIIEEGKSGWERRLVLISWYGHEAGYEIRSFKDGKPGKLTKLTEDGIKSLGAMISEIKF